MFLSFGFWGRYCWIRMTLKILRRGKSVFCLFLAKGNSTKCSFVWSCPGAWADCKQFFFPLLIHKLIFLSLLFGFKKKRCFKRKKGRAFYWVKRRHCCRYCCRRWWESVGVCGVWRRPAAPWAISSSLRLIFQFLLLLLLHTSSECFFWHHCSLVSMPPPPTSHNLHSIWFDLLPVSVPGGSMF